MSPPRNVAILVFDGIQILDVTGPAAVFSAANDAAGADVYRLHLLSEQGGPIASNGAVTIATMPLASLDPGAVDTLLFSGGEDDAVLQASANPAMRDWLLRAAHKSRRVGSICSGALALARLGLLDGKRATTHWSACEKMAALFPGVKVAPDAVYVEDGRMWTSAGVTTGIDMTLQMVADDVGESIANVIAKRLVIATRRPGYQAQVSAVIAAHEKADPDFSTLLAWVQARLSDQVDVAAMAAQVAMSPRTFHRPFPADAGPLRGDPAARACALAAAQRPSHEIHRRAVRLQRFFAVCQSVSKALWRFAGDVPAGDDAGAGIHAGCAMIACVWGRCAWPASLLFSVKTRPDAGSCGRRHSAPAPCHRAGAALV